jgi:uncharacterized membrane protein
MQSGLEGPSVERSVGLTDAVVAIAMTLLILPLVEVAGEVDTDDLEGVLAEHWDLFLSFVVSFLVIYVFWSAHSTAFRRLVGHAVEVPALRPLNMCWLLVIAFLPFPTAVVGRDLTTTSAPFYIGSMFVLSALTSAILVVVARATGPSPRVRWAWLTTAVFGGCTLVSLFNADLGMFALLLLVVVRFVEVRFLNRHG